MEKGFKGSIDDYIAAKRQQSQEFADEYDQEDIRLKLAVMISQKRREANLSQAQLAEKASLPQSTVARIELGDNYPSSKTLQAIAKALNKKLSVQLV
ncbi:helix-turn-helix domain-containing protein [Oenococcus oeni]|uniref:HTH cro/C1-type domain-containing protein n=5 Tax=Oenococcus oeni TaxID=1247 RepID=D3LA43_OENOE|nr:helix-turn-helix transcriptional regulator [Oenococcus oeni]EFD88195.1 hypothetical protein AWRIB429_1223 [Oenococcus oeni AWRIB429]EJO11131.1 XRE family transcriptional regulator [Oenococcus oeni AWRIB576]EJO11698.1 XRE family transcriptional regulator [Oenococcus oeni AWRIB568]KGH61133.1 transcriptional regulator [Oenococcus oeni S28]KGI01407.1 transcriptional regulator [Oenococcus oeni IOEB_L65_2]